MNQALVVVGALVFSAAAVLGYFGWQELRGIGPAVRAPSRDIVEVLEHVNTSGSQIDFPLVLPENFRLKIFAADLIKPRVIIEDPRGVVLVSIPGEGRVVALPDADSDGVADSVIEVLSDLDRPHGLALECAEDCTLYVAEVGQVVAYTYEPSRLAAVNPREVALLPTGGRHTTRYLLVKDDQLLISIGSACDTCLEKDQRQGTIQTVSLLGGETAPLAQGLRNAVFMVEHPESGEVWVTEMGRDHLGDDLPPDEVNTIQPGYFYGWPYCYGNNVQDTTFDDSAAAAERCQAAVASRIDIPAHSAPLGLTFVPVNSAWPREYWGDLLVAYHGSWNRSVPTGYKVVRFEFEEDGTVARSSDFISGWLQDDGTALGRPAGLLARRDGTLLISDDKAGVIYLVSSE